MALTPLAFSFSFTFIKVTNEPYCFGFGLLDTSLSRLYSFAIPIGVIDTLILPQLALQTALVTGL